VVITSSIASLKGSEKVKDGKQVIYDESSENTVSTLHYDSYSFSKVKAEEATNEYMASLPEKDRYLSTLKN